MADEQQGGTKRRGRGNSVLIILAGLLIATLIGVIIFLVVLLMRTLTQSEPAERQNRAVVVTEDNVDDILREMEELEAPQVYPYVVTMNSTWNFPSGTSPSSDMFVANAEDNERDVYFDVQLRDTGEVIYESPVLPVGTYIQNITLDKDLDPGSYRCVCVYHLVDENQNTLSYLNIGLTINVLS